MTLDQLLKKVDWLELNPSPYGFMELRKAIKEYASEVGEAHELLAMLDEVSRPEGRDIKTGSAATGLSLPKSSGK